MIAKVTIKSPLFIQSLVVMLLVSPSFGCLMLLLNVNNRWQQHPALAKATMTHGDLGDKVVCSP
jgi:hypothetical protein